MRGFIYPLFRLLIRGFFLLNLVEHFKVLLAFFWKKDRIGAIHLAIDLFIVAKFVCIGLFIVLGVQGIAASVIAWYLLSTNVFTYFYYHVWVPPFSLSVPSKQRRLINFLTAVVFSGLCFAYLYSSMPVFGLTGVEGILYSFENSFGMAEQASTQIARVIALIQVFISFLFISIILSGTSVKVGQGND